MTPAKGEEDLEGEVLRLKGLADSKFQSSNNPKSALKYGKRAQRLLKKEAPTFWTACSDCRLLHQFERRYVGHSLVCPNCNKSFKAVETVLSDGSSDEGEKVRRNRKKREVVLGVAAPNWVKGKVGGEKVGSLKGKVGDGGGLKKRMRSVGEVLERSMPKRIVTGEETMTLAEFQSQVKRKVQQEKVKVNDKEEEWGRKEKRSLRKRVGNRRGLEIGGVGSLKLPFKEKPVKNKRGSERSLKKNVKLAIKEKPEASVKRKELGLEECGDADGGELEVMAVVDSDFYDFDKDRVERSFKKGQVWVAYDDDDGPDRCFVVVDRHDYNLQGCFRANYGKTNWNMLILAARRTKDFNQFRFWSLSP